MLYKFSIKITEKATGDYLISSGETDIKIGDTTVNAVMVHCMTTHHAQVTPSEALHALLEPFEGCWHEYPDESTCILLIGGACTESTLLDISMGNPLNKIR